MGLFDNIRQEILEEFNSFVGDKRHEIKYDSNGTFNSRSSAISKPKDYAFLDKLEMKRWSCNPICPHCGSSKYYIMGSTEYSYRCGNFECKSNFNVLTKTVLENTKIELNKWYDLVKYCRDAPNESTRSLGKSLQLTQKTIWWMIAKLKSNELFMETDVPIIHILLTPKPFTVNSYTTKKPSFREYEKLCFAKLKIVYKKDARRLSLLETTFALLRTHYGCRPPMLAKEIGMSKYNLYRYLSGSRKLSEKSAQILASFINSKLIKATNLLIIQ